MLKQGNIFESFLLELPVQLAPVQIDRNRGNEKNCLARTDHNLESLLAENRIILNYKKDTHFTIKK